MNLSSSGSKNLIKSASRNRPYALLIVCLALTDALFGQWSCGGGVCSTTNSVGIGTASPSRLLEVSGSNPLIQTTNTSMSGSPFLLMGMNSDNNAALFQASSGKDFRFYNGQYALTILGSNGNVGIGTITPSLFGEKLTVSGNNTGEQLGVTVLNQSTSNVAGKGSSMMLLGTDTVGNQKYLAKILGTADDSNVQQTHLGFYTAYSGGLNERMRIDTLGNVGIGTTAPAYGLDLSGFGSSAMMRANATSGDSAFFLSNAGTNKFKIYRDTTGQYAFLSTLDAYPVALGVNNSISMWLANGGNVGIGTTNPQYKLSVNGTIQGKEVVVNTGWADYVFNPQYQLKPLSEVASYIKENHHLPDMPTEAEVQDKGIGIGEMQVKMLAKIEELTLHLIDVENQNRELRERVLRLESQHENK